MFVCNQICTPDKTSRNSKLFYERNGKLNSCDRYEYLSQLNNRINFIIQIQIQIQITLFFPEIVHNNYMGIYKMNHRIT